MLPKLFQTKEGKSPWGYPYLQQMILNDITNDTVSTKSKSDTRAVRRQIAAHESCLSDK